MSLFSKAKFSRKDHFQRLLFLMALSLFAHAGLAMPVNEDVKPTWGINAVILKPQNENPTPAAELLTNEANSVSLGRFYRAGGKSPAATPTECRVTYDRDSLDIVFRCSENDLAYPAMSHNADWYSLLGTPVEQDSAFPDKVDLFIQPDLSKSSYYQFTVTLDGLKFGCRHHTRPIRAKSAAVDDEAGTAAYDRVDTFAVTEVRKEKEWIVLLQIPWKTLGGKPADFFGLLPMRTRWRDGEISCPAAIDFGEEPPVDLFVETHFSGPSAVPAYDTSLCQLPSGVQRWQRPARLTYPDRQTLQQIWQMQRSLSKPTGEDNFLSRLHLTQRWIDLLILEGFNFRPGSGSIVEEDLTPSALRREINGALRHGQSPRAYELLDAYLLRLGKSSAQWFADGSPSDIAKQAWQPLSEVKSLEVKDNVLTMQASASGQTVDLHLSLPATGGVRIYGNEGYFKPTSLLPLNLIQTSNGGTLDFADGSIAISQSPFNLLLRNNTGKVLAQIDPGDLAFRFSPTGKILAVDFKNHLDPDEVIYGFGERYDYFNERGHVLTLWGMDDWLGNTVGLMNETYKPIPVFHSSKGLMVFDNSSYRLRVDIGQARPDEYRLTQSGPVFDYYFWPGSPEKALQSYTDLTGKPVLPPGWAFEPWMGRTGRGWIHAPGHNPVAAEENATEHMSQLDIPYAAIYSEGPGADSSVLNTYMAARGIKVLSWYYPAISRAAQSALLPEIKSGDLPVLNTGNSRSSTNIDYVDFTNPNALELSRRWWKKRLDLGVAGSMVDFGDRVPEEAIFYDGRRGDEMHNFFAYDYHRTYSEVFREKYGDDFILIGRAAAPGSQKWVAQFGGDHPSNFAGLQAVLTGALNLSACGFSIWGSDLGGFLGWPDPDVYIRWTQFGCFSPLMRCHGRTPREPWYYGETAVANYKYYGWVRENLLDYICQAATVSHETGIPIMRSLAIAYPDELPLASVSDEYMFGSDLLVAPMVTGNNLRTISFPPGKWSSLWDGTTIAGPTNLKITVPLQTIPVYLKQGAILPIQLNSVLQWGGSMANGHVTAFVITPPPATMSCTNVQGAAGVVVQSTDHHLSITLKNLPGMDCLLVYDAAVVEVKMDGQILPHWSGKDFAAMSPGWQKDPEANRVVIRLPASPEAPGRSTLTNELELELGPSRPD